MFDWVKSLFSNVGVSLVNAVGNVLDTVTTTDHEIALTDNQKLKIQAAFELEAKKLLAKAEEEHNEHIQALEAEITKRLQIDMAGDAWLPKNIRPLALIFLSAVVSAIAFFTIFDNGLTDQQLKTLEIWVPFFSPLMLLAYGFYFGSRGLEKIAKIREMSKDKVYSETIKVDSMVHNYPPTRR